MDIEKIEEYVDSIFAYCIKRTGNMDDAQDLSQDIICEVLRAAAHTEIKSFEAWLWKIAHNRYVKYLNGKKKRHISIYENGLIDTLTDGGEESDRAEDCQAAFAALHGIAKSHRDLLVDRYINELSYAELSEKYGLPEGTVKTRLHYGRKKLRERWQQTLETKRVYEKINWFISGNGNVDVSYIERQLPRAIVTACYEKAMDIEAISDATGIPCMYVEDEIPALLHGEILGESAGKYISNIIIHSEKTTNEIEKILLNASGQFAEKTAAILRQHMPQLREVGFYGCDFSESRLWWFIIPVVWREACEQSRKRHGATERGAFPPRLDGGNGWVIVNELGSEQHRYFSGCNGYFLEKSKFYYYWSSKYFSEELNSFLYKLESRELSSAEFAKCGFDEVLTAECIKYNLAKNNNWTIPVFTQVQYGEFMALIKQIAEPLSEKIYPVVKEVYAIMRRATPKHLHEQIRGVFGAELNSIIAMICDELEMQGLLEVPGGEYFTGQIILCLE